MNLRTTLTSGTVGIASTGLALTGLVAGASGASAAPAAASTAPAAAAKSSLATTYVCSNDIIQDQEIPTSFKVKLPKKVKSGSKVDPIPFTVQNTVPNDLRNVLSLLGVTEISGTATGATVKVGPQKVKVGKVKIPATPVPAQGDLELNGSGKSKAFKAGKPGKYDVLSPKGFTADLRDQNDETLPGGPLNCSLADGADNVLGSVTVTR